MKGACAIILFPLSKQSDRTKVKNKKTSARFMPIEIRIRKTIHVICTGLDASEMPSHQAARVRR